MTIIAHLKKLTGESLIYGVSGMIARFIGVFLVPLYTRIFEPSDYGVIGLVITLAALLNILVVFGLDNSLARWFYDETEAEKQKTMTTFFLTCIAAALILGAIVAVFSDALAIYVLREPHTGPLLLLLAANLPLSIFAVFTTNVLRIQRRPLATAIFSIATSLINIALNVIFVIVLRKEIEGIFYAQIISSVIAAIWTIVLFARQISPRTFSLTRLREMVVFSLPLVPGSVAFWVLNLSGAYFVNLIGDAREAGLFYVGTSIASVVALFGSAFQMAWGPFAYSIYKRSEAKQVYANVLLLFTGVFTFLALGAMLFAPEALMILTTTDYYGAAGVAGILAFNQTMIGLGYIASIGTGIAKDNRAYGAGMAGSAILLVALNLLLIPRFGKEGAAVSILISQAVVPIAVFAHGQKLFSIPYRFGVAAMIFSSGLALGISTMMVLGNFSPSQWIATPVKVGVVAAFAVSLYLVLNREFRSFLVLDLESANES